MHNLSMILFVGNIINIKKYLAFTFDKKLVMF
jgi:hypothetical protein